MFTFFIFVILDFKHPKKVFPTHMFQIILCPSFQINFLRSFHLLFLVSLNFTFLTILILFVLIDMAVYFPTESEMQTFFVQQNLKDINPPNLLIKSRMNLPASYLIFSETPLKFNSAMKVENARPKNKASQVFL